MPIVLVYAAAALTGIIITGIVISKIASHFDGTAASASYTASVVTREKALLDLHAKGVSFADADKMLGARPTQPSGFKTGTFATVLILGGAAAVAAAIFLPRMLRSSTSSQPTVSA